MVSVDKSKLGVKGGEGTIGTPQSKRNRCDCEYCRMMRAFHGQRIEAEQFLALTGAARQNPPPMPTVTNTTQRLQ